MQELCFIFPAVDAQNQQVLHGRTLNSLRIEYWIEYSILFGGARTAPLHRQVDIDPGLILVASATECSVLWKIPHTPVQSAVMYCATCEHVTYPTSALE